MSPIQVELNDRTVLIESSLLLRLQALWRGALVRKQMTSLRRKYEETIKETELPGYSLQLTWKSQTLSIPIISKCGQPGLTVCTKERHNSVKKTEFNDRQTDSKSYSDSTSINDRPSSKKEKSLWEKSNVSYVKKKDPLNSSEQSENSSNTGARKESVTTAVNENPTEDSSGTSEIPSQETSTEKVPSQEDSSQNVGKGKHVSEEIPTVTQNTMVWDSVDLASPENLTDKQDREALLQEKSAIEMDMLWIQQAIESRKQYLRLRQQMT